MLKYTLTIKISWGHCDPAKIVFYPNYFIWFDQSVHFLFDKAGANMGGFNETIWRCRPTNRRCSC